MANKSAISKEWAESFAKVWDDLKPHGRKLEIATRLHTKDYTLAKLAKGQGSLRLAFAVSVELGLDPPVEGFPEPWRAFLVALVKARAAGHPEHFIESILLALSARPPTSAPPSDAPPPPLSKEERPRPLTRRRVAR